MGVVEYCLIPMPELSVKTLDKKIVSPDDYLDSKFDMIFNSRETEEDH